MTPFFKLTLSLVASGFDVPSDAILSRGRSEPIVTARHTLWYLLRKIGWTNQAVASNHPGLHFSAIQHGVARINGMLEQKDKRFLTIINRLVRLHAQSNYCANLSWNDCIGANVLIKRTKNHRYSEAHVERVTTNGDGVKLKIVGREPKWFQQQEWMIVEKLQP